MRSSDVRFRLAGRQEGGDRLTSMSRIEERPQVLQHVSFLLPAGGHHAQRSLHEPTTSLAIRTPADPPPDHRESQRSLRRVVRRFDPFDPRQRPQSLFDLEDLEARRRRLRATAPRPLQESLATLASQSNHPILEPLPVQSPVPHSVPIVEQPMRQFQQSLADRLPATTAIDHRLKIAAKMGPTNLSPPGRDPLVGTESIAGDDLIRLAAQQGPGHLAGAVAGDGEDRGQPGHGDPEPGLLAILSPRRLVDVRRVGGVDRDGQLVVRRLQDLGTASLQLRRSSRWRSSARRGRRKVAGSAACSAGRPPRTRPGRPANTARSRPREHPQASSRR